MKPNWVLHETQADFPIRALVTDARLIEVVVNACLEVFPDCESIQVIDCPLQWSDWHLMCRQSGLEERMGGMVERSGGRVSFHDLRREVFAMAGSGYLQPNKAAIHGDPAGYREVSLGGRSHLEPLCGQAHKFAVNDYRSSVTTSNHSSGNHRYFVSQSVLNSDLFINLPKWKSHQKSGITAALKNLVGINGDKAYLPHFRRGAPRWGGDEYSDDHRWMYWWQTHLREFAQKRSKLLFSVLKPGWEFYKRLRGVETKYRNVGGGGKVYYAAGGGWYGNDTLWRMIYDLNLVIQCVDREGVLRDEPQRHYYTIVDGIVSGEGNGPLQPLPRETDWLVFGADPFAVDAVLAQCMGFDLSRLPLIRAREEYLGPDWGDFECETLPVQLDGHLTELGGMGVNFRFAPPPGWRGHIEY